jgi:RHS repeat-associated protein
VKKVANGETTLYHYDFDGKLIAESDDQSYTHTKAEYIYRGQSLLAKVDYEDYSPTAISYYLNDKLGTPQIMTNENRQVIWEALYEPFGNAAVNSQSSRINNIRFPGQFLDAETGFHYNYHRYYDPKTGRYLSPDPIGQAGGINLFAYAKNNPVRFIDLMGLDVFATCWYTSGGAYLGVGHLECAVEETE